MRKKNKGLRVGIVGYGFVGKAVEFGFKNNNNEIKIIDPKHNTFVDDLQGFLPDLTFVCVPTPMGDDSAIDASIIEKVMQNLSMVTGTIVIKSTITPDLADKLCARDNVVYNPEFLTERNAADDFINPPMHILGGIEEYTNKVEEYYKEHSNCNPATAYHMTAQEASFVKYGVNSFLATKVLWFNQYKDLIEKYGAKYNVIANAIASDPRIGPSHTKVPGPDGRKGYGGACFPKDTAALYTFSNTELSVLGEVIEANNQYRSEYELDDREKEQNVIFLKKSS